MRRARRSSKLLIQGMAVAPSDGAVLVAPDCEPDLDEDTLAGCKLVDGESGAAFELRFASRLLSVRPRGLLREPVRRDTSRIISGM